MMEILLIKIIIIIKTIITLTMMREGVCCQATYSFLREWWWIWKGSDHESMNGRFSVPPPLPQEIIHDVTTNPLSHVSSSWKYSDTTMSMLFQCQILKHHFHCSEMRIYTFYKREFQYLLFRAQLRNCDETFKIIQNTVEPRYKEVGYNKPSYNKVILLVPALYIYIYFFFFTLI